MSVSKHSNGNWIVDYGETVWGGFILDINPNDTRFDGNGRYVEVLMGEILYGPAGPDLPGIPIIPGTNNTNRGRVKNSAANMCTFVNRFFLLNQQQVMRNWGTSTFRYAEFLNLPDFVDENNFTDYVQAYRLIYPADFSESYFESSNEWLDTIYDFCKRTIELLNLDVYMDSPNRERLPYEADAFVHMRANYASNDSYELARHTAEYMLFNSTWPMQWQIFAIKMMYEDYMHTGDNSLLVRHYDNIKLRLHDFEYYRRTNITHSFYDGFDRDTGVMTIYGPNARPGNGSQIYDWLPIAADHQFSQSNQNVATNSYFYDAAYSLGIIAEAAGKTEDAALYLGDAAKSKAAIQELFFDVDRNMFLDSLTGPATTPTIPNAAVQLGVTRTNYSFLGQVFPLAFGAATEEQGKAAAAFMAEASELRTNVYGSAFTLPAMFRYGQGVRAVQFITGIDENGDIIRVTNNSGNAPGIADPDGVPSVQNWRNMIQQGSGTTMEAWRENDDSTISHSHPFAAAPVFAITDDMMGIRPLSPAYETLLIKPVESGVAHASVAKPTIRGFVKVAYQKDEAASALDKSRYTLDVTVPGNTTATLVIPCVNIDTITEGGLWLKDGAIDGISVLDNSHDLGNVYLELGSGEYSFTVNNPYAVTLNANGGTGAIPPA